MKLWQNPVKMLLRKTAPTTGKITGDNGQLLSHKLNCPGGVRHQNLYPNPYHCPLSENRRRKTGTGAESRQRPCWHGQPPYPKADLSFRTKNRITGCGYCGRRTKKQLSISLIFHNSYDIKRALTCKYSVLKIFFPWFSAYAFLFRLPDPQTIRVNLEQFRQGLLSESEPFSVCPDHIPLSHIKKTIVIIRKIVRRYLKQRSQHVHDFPVILIYRTGFQIYIFISWYANHLCYFSLHQSQMVTAPPHSIRYRFNLVIAVILLMKQLRF